jgi:hypothetical protein
MVHGEALTDLHKQWQHINNTSKPADDSQVGVNLGKSFTNQRHYRNMYVYLGGGGTDFSRFVSVSINKHNMPPRKLTRELQRFSAFKNM